MYDRVLESLFSMFRILEPKEYSSEAISIYRLMGPVAFGYPDSVDDVSRVLVVRLGYYIGCEILRLMPKLRAVISPTTGLNHLDTKALEGKSIKVLYLGDVRDRIEEITSTPEHTLLLALGINRRMGVFMHDCTSQSRLPTFYQRDQYKGKEVSEQTLGILGAGRIGRRLISLSRSVFHKVITWDKDEHALLGLEEYRTRDVEQLFRQSNTLCICIDYRIENRGFVSDSLLSFLPEGSCLINTSRGEVVDERAVLSDLRSHRLFGYATDVLSEEQSTDPADSPVIRAFNEGLNVLVTPHIGGCTSTAMEKTEIIMAEKFVEMKECILV